MNDSKVIVDLICNNCQMSMHIHNCRTLLGNNVCNCNKSEFYDVVISGNILDGLKSTVTVVGN